ncbi:MAG: hypothetical protein AAF745_11905, partial [Planctomycetota bacterium]
MTSLHRLSRIETLWTVVYDAHTGDDQARLNAQHELLARYGEAIQAYLRGAFRDASLAEDAYQSFAVRFLNGEYRSAHESKGRFRSFLKVV